MIVSGVSVLFAVNLSKKKPCLQAEVITFASSYSYRVQVTLRTLPGEDELQLLSRMHTFLDQFPAPEPPPQTGAGQAQPAEPPVPEGWCRRHNLQMALQRSKDPGKPGTWYSHRLADGTWCRGK
jgi:hypothetical protein